MRLDCGFGNEGFLVGCEERSQKYLSRLRLTKGVQDLIRALSAQGGWKDCGAGWEGLEGGKLRLKGWTRSRRVVVLRRKCPAKPLELASESGVRQAELLAVEAEEPYEYTVRDQRLTALPSGRAERRVDLQLVEFVCPLRGAIPASGSGDEPTVADVCGRPAGEPRGPDDRDPDQHPWRSGAGAGNSDQAQSVFERAEEYCGAVECFSVLAADLGENLDALSSAGSGVSDAVRPGSQTQRVIGLGIGA